MWIFVKQFWKMKKVIKNIQKVSFFYTPISYLFVGPVNYLFLLVCFIVSLL